MQANSFGKTLILRRVGLSQHFGQSSLDGDRTAIRF
jgi:hypothetical protein